MLIPHEIHRRQTSIPLYAQCTFLIASPSDLILTAARSENGMIFLVIVCLVQTPSSALNLKVCKAPFDVGHGLPKV